MATILDLSLLKEFDIIFPMLLVFSLVFAVLQNKKYLSDNASINAMIAIVAAFTVALSGTAVSVLNFSFPWFAVAIIFFVLVLLVFQVFGATEGDIRDYLKGSQAIGWVIIAVSLIIILAGLGNVFGQTLTDLSFDEGASTNSTIDGGGVGTPSHQQNIIGIFFNAKVLGLVTLFAIAIFTILLLTA